MAKARQPAIPCDQNFWQLASIQVVSIGLAGILLGAQLAREFGAATAITSIIIGNLMLWLMSLAIIAMSSDHRTHSIENVREFLGRWGSIAGAIILLLAFIFWFALQLEFAVSTIDAALRDHGFDLFNLKIRTGSVLGIVIALVSIGGIQLIKRICTICLPILLVYLIYAMLVSDHQTLTFIDWRPSLLAVLATIAYNLGGIVSLPTFFRHSKSKPHAFLALTLIFIFYSILEGYSIWFIPTDFSAGMSGNGFVHIFHFVLFLFIIIMLSTCANLVNIYFGSSGWETVIPMKRSAREYVIVGLAGTMVFAFLQDAAWTFVLEGLFIGYLGCMGIALVASFLIKVVVTSHRVRRFEKIISSICWGIGCVVVTIYQVQPNAEQGRSLAAGSVATAIAVLVFIFIEETCWSIGKILSYGKR